MDRLVTVFGGGGFLGRYVVQALFKRGARVRIVGRDPRRAFFLKPLGGLGQAQFVAADVAKSESVARAVAGSDSVVNLVGILKGDFAKVQADGAATVAEAAAAAGATALVHMSAIGADASSASAYGRSKGEGEARTRAAFPAATILRPSILFGAEDAFLNRFAGMLRIAPVVPVVRPDVRFQPVWVGDVARATAIAATEPERFAGRDFALGGPETIAMAALITWLGETTGRRRPLLRLPDGLAALIARFGGRLPGAPITWDQWLMLQQDNVVPPGAAGFEAFDIVPAPLGAKAPAWLVSFRRHGRFAADPTTDAA